MNQSAPISRRRLLAAGAAGLALPVFLPSTTQAQKGAIMRLKLTFADQQFTATLEDSAAARELFALLPLDLTIDDYSTNEKIAYLPNKLSDDGSARFENEAVGDLCYYAPWGDLAMFHGPYRWSRGLVRLGRLDQGAKPLLVRGEFPLRIEALT